MPVTARRPVPRVRSTYLIPIAMLLAILSSAVISIAAPTDVFGATNTKAAACSGVNLRKSASTSGAIRTTITAGTKVTVVATVGGSSWRVTCAGRTVSGSTWYRISAINGKSVTSLYGLSYLYSATGLFKAVTTTTVATTTTKVAACSGVNLRRSASTTAGIRTTIKSGTRITVVATVSGGLWRVTCAGRTVSSNKWYRISAINGRSVRSLYGLSYLYSATGSYKAVTTTVTPAPAPTPTPIPTPTPTPVGPTEGIDVSHWQGVIDWPTVSAAGKRFAFMKADEAADFIDATYLTNRAQANAAGLHVGAYHFAQPDISTDDAVNEAEHFMAAAQLVSGDLLPVLDLEITGGLTTTQLQDWVRTYMERIYARTGLRGVIYISPAFWAKYAGDTTWFADNGYKVLWIAHWTIATEPTVAAADWGGHGWTFWQYTSSGTVPGISTRVDLDRYVGTDFTDVLIP
jgi:GH25 family lysozyme M1 (1,4-beta-N-acetylmuramidase)